MISKNYNIEHLKDLLSEKKIITLFSHVNPDGDAVGSGLAMTGILRKMGHQVMFATPNDPPQFLNWLAGTEDIKTLKNNSDYIEDFVKKSEIIFFLDFNQITRTEEIAEIIMKNNTAVKVLIDHHINPPEEFDIIISDTSACSTCFLAYKVVEQLGLTNLIDKSIGDAIYTGIMTDTGNFSFSNLEPELFRCVATLIEKGVTPQTINNAVYNSYSENRMRLMGYVLDKKMVMCKNNSAAYITLTTTEQNCYAFQPGDTEGFVNLPMAIKGVNLTVFMSETKECIKISLRSKGDIDVNLMARKYFNGGGHKNAAGGKSFTTMQEAVDIFLEAINNID